MSNAENRKAVTVIVPRVVAHNLDAHTGIPFMPHMAAYLAGALDNFGYDVQVIDCFGLDPHNRNIDGEFMFLGVSEEWVAGHIAKDTKIVFLYCRTVEDVISVERIAMAIKRQRPDIYICLFENIQTVNSFSLRLLVDDLFKAGCDIALLGEPERRAADVVEAVDKGLPFDNIAGLAYKLAGKVVFTKDATLDSNLDELPFPLWEKFPLEGYWIIGFAHAPVNKHKFLPLLTSRGCPFQCTFCISPQLNPKWRARSAKNVVDEMEYFYKRLGIKDYHISDLNPTVSDKRIHQICEEIISRKLPVVWKLAQGTKIETIKSEDTLDLMAKAGCRYISFSPETGSSRLLKIMKKPFDHVHGLKMLSRMSRLGIRTQACFVVGVPGENKDDQEKSIDYVKKLVACGIDEIAVYIFTPLPGAQLADSIGGYTHHSQCTRSPTWGKDYKIIQRFRIKMYMVFFLHKLTHPKKVIREIIGFFTGRFETKMEMSIYKQLKLYLLYYIPNVFRRLNPEERLKELAAVHRDINGFVKRQEAEIVR